MAVPLVITIGSESAKVEVAAASLEFAPLSDGLLLTGDIVARTVPPGALTFFKVKVLSLPVVEARTAMEVMRMSSPELVASICQLPKSTLVALATMVLAVGVEFLVTVRVEALTVCVLAEVLEAGVSVTESPVTSPLDVMAEAGVWRLTVIVLLLVQPPLVARLPTTL